MVNAFKSFFYQNNLSESLQMAKDYVLKKYAESKDKKVPELSEDEKKKVLNDPAFKDLIDLFRIKDYVPKEGSNVKEAPLDQKLLAYAPIFAKFYYEQDANLLVLEELLEKLSLYKTNIDKDIPMKIQDYTKIYKVKSKKERREELLKKLKEEDPKKYLKMEMDPDSFEEIVEKEVEKQIEKEKREGIKYDSLKPGWELLIDDLNKIPEKTAFRKFRDSFLPKMKKELENATPEQLKILEAMANRLSVLKPITDEVTDPVTGKIKKETRDPWRDFGKFIGSYENSPLVIPELNLNYPNGYYCGQKIEGGGYMRDYRDPKVAFQYMIEDIVPFVQNWGVKKGGDRTRELLKKLGPRAGLLYADDKYEVVSCRNYEAVKEFIPDSRFCTKNIGSYWTYNSEKLQILIWDFEKGPVNNMYQVGISVDKNQVITAAFDKENVGIDGAVGGTLEKYFMVHGFPVNVIIQTCKKFNVEYNIKLSLEYVFKIMEGTDMKDSDGREKAYRIIKSLIQALRGVEVNGDDMNRNGWDQLVNVVTEILIGDEGLKVSDFLSHFKANGVPSTSSLEVLKKIILSEISKEDWQDIYNATLKTFKSMEGFMKLQDSKFSSKFVDKTSIPIFKKSLEDKEKILSELEQKIK